VCGATAPQAWGSGNCSINTSEFADWWCQLGGYEQARSYTEVTTGVINSLYYNGGAPEVLSQCSQVVGPVGYGYVNTTCHGAQNLICQPRPVPTTLRSSVMVCGSSSFSVASAFPSGSGLTATTGCAPTSSTQALMLTRSWASGITGAALRSYLHEGGVVMTEYGVTDDIWNIVFPTAPLSTTTFGGCNDNVPQMARFNATDPFWQNNTWASGQTASEAGCGYAIQQLPLLVALGGWDATNVGFGYRNVGMGRFWATDFDWQDNNAKQPYTLTQMGYMMTRRR
jgi:hypothetical protein